MIDTHVHTHLSCDSEETMAAYLYQAERKGVKVLCFTEHADFNPYDYGYLYYNPDAFFRDIGHAKRLSAGKVEILSGIEFGETHLYPHQLRLLLKYPYDFVLGSIHWVNNLFPDEKTRMKYDAKEFFDMYWTQMLEMVKFGGFDSLAHIDFPKRYYGELHYKGSVLREIFSRLLENDAVIEINTSSLRKGCPESMPAKEIIELYRDMGGKCVTIGSDSHIAGDLAADFEKARALAEEMGLEICLYRERKRYIWREASARPQGFDMLKR
ncbi:MAG: histidinol-phosphatase HisJ family protein [Clostridia bacterium]|nr:histidinol-phosphatase HisJ family protein [Clostridia bacterium]MBQ4157491.1 histidinol-phosphatase HisJ family protein [Clostridia bacterium]